MKYLRNELEDFDGLVVLLGATPLSAFLGRGTISSYRGYGFSLGGKQFFVTYHPSYILRRGTSAIRKLFTDDLRKVRKWLDTKKQVPFVLISSVEELERFLVVLPVEGELSFDIETTGLSPFAYGAKILSIAFSDGSRNWVVPLEHPDSNFATSSERIVNKLVHTFKEKRIKLMGHNAKFDLLWLRVLYGVDNLDLVFDTMVGNYLLVGNNAPQGLKNLAWYYTDYGGYEILDTGSLIDYPIEQVAAYNAMDAFVTYLVAEKIRHLLSERQLFLAEKILAPVSQVLVEMEADGLRIHTENLEALLSETIAQIQEIEERLHSYPEVQEIEKETGELVKFNSPQQLVRVLKRIGLLPSKKTKKGAISVDEEALKEIKTKHPFIEDILKYREVLKLYTTYLKPYSKSLSSGIIRGNYLLTRTATGRLACHDPNLQNIPYEIRRVFTTKRDYLVEVDYSQLELRVMAMYSKDGSFISAFKNDEDIHEKVRYSIFGDNSHLSPARRTKQRSEAKSVNFGILYGVSEHGWASMLGVSKKRAREMIETFFVSHPAIKEFIDYVKDFVMQHSYFETFFGRRRYFNFHPAMEQALREKICREAINFPIQSTARDLVFDAEVRVWRWMRENRLESRMVADVHDSVIFDVVEDELEELLVNVKLIMEDFSHFDWVNVPLKIDIKIGTVWGELEELEL